MVRHGSIGKAVKPGQQETFEVSFADLTGVDSNYTAKVFVWDGTNMGNTKGLPLSGVNVMPTTSPT